MISQNQLRISPTRNVDWAVASLCGMLTLFFMQPAYADIAVWEKLSTIREQYQNIKTMHVKSQMFVESSIPIAQDQIKWIDYEQWANKDGHYKIICRYFAQNGNVLSDWEFTYNGKTFYAYDKLIKTISYGKEEPNEFPIPENPLFAPVLFLGKHSDACPCPLKLKDICSSDKWQNGLIQARQINVLDGSRTAIAIPTNRTIKNGSRFDFNVHIDPSGLVEKVNKVGTMGNIFTSIAINEYRDVNLAGKETRWPKTIQIIEYDQDPNTTTKLTAEISLVEIDDAIPDDIFTIDMASAKSVWDSDAKVFVKTGK